MDQITCMLVLLFILILFLLIFNKCSHFVHEFFTLINVLFIDLQIIFCVFYLLNNNRTSSSFLCNIMRRDKREEGLDCVITH